MEAAKRGFCCWTPDLVGRAGGRATVEWDGLSSRLDGLSLDCDDILEGSLAGSGEGGGGRVVGGEERTLGRSLKEPTRR